MVRGVSLGILIITMSLFSPLLISVSAVSHSVSTWKHGRHWKQEDVEVSDSLESMVWASSLKVQALVWMLPILLACPLLRQSYFFFTSGPI